MEPKMPANVDLPPGYEGSPLFLIFFWLVAASIYFIPSMLAISRRHNNALQIFFLNLYAGWTGFGFVAALIWAFTHPHAQVTETVVAPAPAAATVAPAAAVAAPVAPQAAGVPPVQTPAAPGLLRKILKVFLWLFAAIIAFVFVTMLFAPDTAQTPPKFVPSGMPVPADDMFGN